MEAFGSGQTAISPEFLQNIQTAVNSQGVIGQVQVIETENGPVTVLFMEEGADASGAVGENTTINVSSGVENYVVNSEPSVSEENANTQYEFVLTEDEYSDFLQGNAGSIGENVALTTVTETVEEVTSIPPVISIAEVDQQESPSVSDASDLLYATAVPGAAAPPSTNIVSEAATVPETPAPSSDTYYITDTGEVVRIDSSLLAENGNTIVQMQDTGNGLQVINQGESEYHTEKHQTTYTNVVAEKEDNPKPAASSPYELTATKLDARLVIDAPKEEPKVLSYKTTNRQRINIMRQPTKTPPKQTVGSNTYTISQPTKTQKSLLPGTLKTTISPSVGKSVTKAFTTYSATAPKQTIVYPSNVKQTQVSNAVKYVQPKMQHENVVTTIPKPQMLKKTVLSQTGYTKQIVNKVPSSRMTSVQHDSPRTILVPKFTSRVVPKHPANTAKYQSDLLLTAMEEASVSQPITTVQGFSKKQIVSPNPMVVRDPSTASVAEKLKSPSLGIESEAAEEKSVLLPSMPVLEPEAPANVDEEMEVNQSVPDIVHAVIPPTEVQKPSEAATDKPVSEAVGITSTVVETKAMDSAPDKPVLEAMETDKDEKMAEEAKIDDKNIQPKLVTPVASTSEQKVVSALQVGQETAVSKDNNKGTQITDIPDDGLKSIDVPDSDVTIQLFADGTLVTKDKAGTNYSTVKLEDLGLDMSMLQSNTDIELLIVQGDGKEVRATINTSKHVNPIVKPATTVKESVVAAKSDATVKKPTIPGDTDRQVEDKEVALPLNEARPYKCSMCPRTFKFYRTFRCHEIVHSKAVTFTCHLCKRLFAREVNLQSHLELHKKKAAMRPEFREKSKSRACYDCGKVFETEGKMKKHYQAVHEIKPRFPCPICGNLFKSLLVLQKHSKVHVGPFSCPHCDGVFQERGVYDQHIQDEHEELMHTCDDCGVVLPSKQAYAMHVVFQHKEKSSAPAVKRKECIICERRFESHESLERHMIIHSTDKFLECPKCSESFKLMWQLDKHIRDIHDNDVEFTCKKCSEKFAKKMKCDLHMQLYHHGPYQCHVCYEEFVERNLLEEHQFANHDGGFTCSKCGTKFETSQKLKYHLSHDHSSQAYLCETCGAGFEYKPALRAHLIEKHFCGDKTEMLKQYPEMKSVNIEVICDFCGEYYPARTSYKQHLRDIHFGGDSVAMLKSFPSFAKVSDPPMPVTCDHCSKEFRTLSHLNRHLKTHLRGRKKGKVSLDKEELESADDQDDDDDDDPVDFNNIEPRDLEKEYNCKKCNAQFSRKAALDKHIVARHKKDPLKEALKNIEKEELERAELEEKEGFTPIKPKKGGAAQKSKSGSVEESSNLEPNDAEPADTSGPSKTKKIVCNICECVFKTKSKLKFHLEKVHSEEREIQDLSDSSEEKGYSIKNLKCLTCNKQFSKSRYLRRHLRSVHKVFKVTREQDGDLEIKVYPCEKCPKKFDNVGNLNRHVEAKHNKKTESLSKKKKKTGFADSPDNSDDLDNDNGSTGDITSFLEMNFNLAKTSSCNIESVKKKQHKCNLCGKAFSRDATLKKHIAFHAEEDSEDVETMETDDFMGLQPPMYPCKNCDNKYSTALGLIHHNRNKHADIDEETVLAYILEIDERHKAESPRKKVDRDLRKSVKRKAESPKVSPSSPGLAKKKVKVDTTGQAIYDCNLCGLMYSTSKGLANHKKDVHLNAAKVESPQKPLKFSHSGRLITHSQKVMEQIQCDKCSKTFMKEQHLLMHVARVHFKTETESNFSCDVCPKSFDMSSKLSRHRKMKHNLDTSAAEKTSVFHHKCEVCGDKFKTLSDFKQHMTDMHDEVKAESFVCEVCQQAFATQKNLDIHTRTHTGEKPYSCCLCSNSFISKYKLECHMKKLHLKQWQKKVSCKICLALFDTKKAMLRHKVVHRKPLAMEKMDRRKLVPHQCSVCGKSFRWKRTLNAHFATHRNDFDIASLKNDFDTFTCGVCNKVFPDKESIKNHMLVHKKSTDVHSCKSCDRVFTKASGLKLHELSAHKEAQEPAAAPNLYKCGMCDRSFPKRSGLRMHEVSHTGSLVKSGNVSCNICQKNFQSKESLLEHMLSHTSMMPFRCDICSVSFKHAFSLKAHKLIHNMKPASDEAVTKSNTSKDIKERKNTVSEQSKNDKIKCTKCNKQFNSIFMLRNHSRKVHKNMKIALGAGLMRKRIGTRSLSSESREEKKKDDSSKGRICCRMCTKSFSKAEQLKAHMDKFHSKKKLKKKMSIPIKKREGIMDRSAISTKQKFPARHECPNCMKTFTQRYNLRLHLMKAHNATMEKLPPKVDSSRKKWLYCKDCASLFWTQSQYNHHIKHCHPDIAAMDMDKRVMQSLSGNAEVKVEPDEETEAADPVEFKTIQHKCEFCSSVYLTKKLFDEHIVKEHPEHVEEYGIVPEETKPSIELVNDSEDLMGNLISVGLCNVENCKKLSSLPVVSLKRYRGSESGVIVGKEDTEIDENEECKQQDESENVEDPDKSDVDQDDDKMDVAENTDESLETVEKQEFIDQEEDQQNEDVENFAEDHEESNADQENGRISEIKVTENTVESPKEVLDQEDGEVSEVQSDKNSDLAPTDHDIENMEDDEQLSEENIVQKVCNATEDESDLAVCEVKTEEDEKLVENKSFDENKMEDMSVENNEHLLTNNDLNEEVSNPLIEEKEDKSENNPDEVGLEEGSKEIEYIESGPVHMSEVVTCDNASDDTHDNAPDDTHDDASDDIKCEDNESNKIEDNASEESAEDEDDMEVDSVTVGESVGLDIAYSEDIVPLSAVYMQNEIIDSPEQEFTEQATDQVVVNETEDDTGIETVGPANIGNAGTELALSEQTESEEVPATDYEAAVGEVTSLSEKNEDVPNSDAITKSDSAS